MLNLNTGVHLHEIEVPVFINQKLNGSNAFVIHSFCRSYRSVAHFITKFLSHKRRRSFLHQFLMTSLNGTIAFTQVTNTPILISNNLNFDMTRFFNVLFHVHAIVSESCGSFLASRIPSCF